MSRHQPHPPTRILACFALLALANASPTLAQPITAHLAAPSLDRWNYPFNTSPGARINSPTFSAIGTDFFDDREAQFLIGFDTASIVPVQASPPCYSITSASVTVTVSVGLVFEYDPTFDVFQTYLPATDPVFTPDTDAGRPVELYGTAFRNGFSAATYLEDTPFATGSFDPRNAFATDYVGAISTDISNNVRQSFEVVPFAIGVNTSLTPGQLVPENTDLRFDMDLTNPDVLAYLQEALSTGLLRLTISSLQSTSTVGNGGPPSGAVTYPIFFTKENKFALPFGFAARLDMTVELLSPAIQGDINCDGVVNVFDLATLIGNWNTADVGSDLNGDGVVNVFDLATLIGNWTG